MHIIGTDCEQTLRGCFDNIYIIVFRQILSQGHLIIASMTRLRPNYAGDRKK